ncbi:MAG: hypothetical protein HYY30_10245 [Chloroflexi bacterium]|nr:hypothetical protein [Chloroflexota bacterium]
MSLTRSSIDTNFVLPLRDLAWADIALVGGKAANLGELIPAGLPVPDGFVLTTSAFDRFISANGLGSDSPPEAVARGTLPRDLAEALRAAVQPLNGLPLAVRSSAVAEDLADASFAGQYETVLDVRGEEALLAAVRQCWASAFKAHVAAYRTAQRQGQPSGMAILVQQLVAADAAGVAFTANPVTGDRNEAIVSAVRGLGERLVSGRATPDEWLVRGREAICRNAPEGAIEATQALAVADMAWRVAEHFGCPQDIEWALAGGQLFLLQARPITALPEPAIEPIPVPVEVPAGFWERDNSHCPEPLSPVFRSSVIPLHEAAMKRMMVELSLPIDGIQFREIGGWLYARVVPPGGKERPAPPAWLMPLLIRLVPDMRRRVRGMADLIRSDKVGSFVERWYSEWKPSAIARAAELRKVNLASLSDQALEGHLAEALTFVKENLDVHAQIQCADFLVAQLTFACRDLLGWDDRHTFDLLSGLSERTSEPTRRLAELARMAQNSPRVPGLLSRIGNDTARRLAEVDEAFATAFAAYLREFGCRTSAFELAEATLEEKPEVVLRLIRDQVKCGYDPEADATELRQKRAAALAEARSLLANRPQTDRERFERTLARAERAFPIREDHEFYLNNLPLALLRYAILEIGRRLAERGQIDRRDDVIFLEIEEVRSALKGADRRQAEVARRKGELAWVKAHPGPTFYGTPPGTPPSTAAFPPEVRLVLESLTWVLEAFNATQYLQQAKAAGCSGLHGLAASAGRYTGPVRVIMKEAEFFKLQPGDVLVCPITQPAWSILFPSVGALVTDGGGILSHPAIVAREYHVPAVVATGNATSTLRDGQIVTIDGAAGVVEVVS